MDKNTFGNSECCIELVNILNRIKSKKLNKKISSFFQRFTKGLRIIGSIDDKEIKNYMLYLWINKHLSRKSIINTIHRGSSKVAKNIDKREIIFCFLLDSLKVHYKKALGFYKKEK